MTEPGDTSLDAGWRSALAQSPAIIAHAEAAVEVFQDRRARLAPLLVELAARRVDWVMDVPNEEAGALAAEQMAAVTHWDVAHCYSAAERAVLAYADRMILGDGRVPDELFTELRAHLSDVEIIELSYAIGLRIMQCAVIKTLVTEGP